MKTQDMARTESIHFDSPNWVKNKKRFWLARWIKICFWFVIHFRESFYFWFWFILIHFDSQFIWLFSFWFAIHFAFDSLRITNHPRLMINLRIKNQVESKIKGRWIVIHSLLNLGWFDFESKANQSESRIKLVRALTPETILN